MALERPLGANMGRYKADVGIVGGGIAGIVSAFDLLGLGKRVLIVDRDSEANFGGLQGQSRARLAELAVVRRVRSRWRR